MWRKNLILIQNLYIFTQLFYRYDSMNDKKWRRFLFFGGGGGGGKGKWNVLVLIFWGGSYETPYETRKYVLFQILGLRHRYGTYNKKVHNLTSNLEKLDES